MAGIDPTSHDAPRTVQNAVPKFLITGDKRGDIIALIRGNTESEEGADLEQTEADTTKALAPKIVPIIRDISKIEMDDISNAEEDEGFDDLLLEVASVELVSQALNRKARNCTHPA